MRIKKILLWTTVLILLFTISIFNNIKNINATSNASQKKTINAGMIFNRYNDTFLAEIRKHLKDIENENTDKIKFTFYDGKEDSNLVNKLVDDLIKTNIDLLILSMPDTKGDLINEIVYKAKQKSIPIILFNAKPSNLDTIKNYKKSILIKSDTEQSGVLEGKMLVDQWNNDKKSLDKNRDNILQYVILQGNPNSSQTPVRTNAVLKTIKDAGIQTEELASVVCYWNEDCGKTAMEPLFLRYGPGIEAIISNNDAMAIGAIKTLQKYGYNTGNKLKNISVVGIDAVPEAQELIKKDLMLGTVIQNPQTLAEAVYTVGLNLVNGKDPTADTNYKFDDSGVTILIPHEIYTINPAIKNPS